MPDKMGTPVVSSSGETGIKDPCWQSAAITDPKSNMFDELAKAQKEIERLKGHIQALESVMELHLRMLAAKTK